MIETTVLQINPDNKSDVIKTIKGKNVSVIPTYKCQFIRRSVRDKKDDDFFESENIHRGTVLGENLDGNLILEPSQGGYQDWIEKIEIVIDRDIELHVTGYVCLKTHFATMEEAFNDLVPSSGKAFCIAGELVRAYNNLYHAFYQNGDKLSADTYNSRGVNAAKQLEKYCEDKLIREKLEKLYNTKRDDYYLNSLEQMEQMILDYINNNEELYKPFE